jgi:hypothetical protein
VTEPVVKEYSKMDIPPTMAAEMALARQNVAMSVMKQAADMQKQVAAILEQALSAAPPAGRGGSVDVSA